MKLAVTGVSGYFGQIAVSSLEAENAVSQILGLDVAPPIFSSGKLRFVRMDVRNPNLAGYLKDAEIDSLLHLAWIFNPTHNRRFMYDVNVNGTMNVMKACRAAGVKHIVLTGSTTCYGAHGDNTEWLNENAPLRGNPDFPYTHHKVLVETLCDEFEKAYPDILVTRLRVCIALGKRVDNFIKTLILMRGFRHPRVRGHNPAIQFLHEDDLGSLLRQVVLERPAGVYNVTPDDAMPMSQIAEVCHNPFFEYPYWAIRPMAEILWSFRLLPVPASYLPFIMYPWTANSAKIKRRLDWYPRYTTREALACVQGIG